MCHTQLNVSALLTLVVQDTEAVWSDISKYDVCTAAQRHSSDEPKLTANRVGTFEGHLKLKRWRFFSRERHREKQDRGVVIYYSLLVLNYCYYYYYYLFTFLSIKQLFGSVTQCVLLFFALINKKIPTF